jgi:hypothetical protein
MLQVEARIRAQMAGGIGKTVFQFLVFFSVGAIQCIRLPAPVIIGEQAASEADCEQDP